MTDMNDPKTHQTMHDAIALSIDGINDRIQTIFDMVLGIEDFLTELVKLLNESSLSKDKNIKTRLVAMKIVSEIIQKNVVMIRKMLEQQKTRKINVLTMKRTEQNESYR